MESQTVPHPEIHRGPCIPVTGQVNYLLGSPDPAQPSEIRAWLPSSFYIVQRCKRLIPQHAIIVTDARWRASKGENVPNPKMNTNLKTGCQNILFEPSGVKIEDFFCVTLPFSRWPNYPQKSKKIQKRLQKVVV